MPLDSSSSYRSAGLKNVSNLGRDVRDDPVKFLAVMVLHQAARDISAWPIRDDRSSWTSDHHERDHAAAVRYASRLAQGDEDIWCEILGRDPRKVGQVLLALRRD